MKKLVLLAGVFALIMSSCTQDLPVAQEGEVLQDVVFKASTELKYDLFDCDFANPDYALLTIIWDHNDNGDIGEIGTTDTYDPASPEYAPLHNNFDFDGNGTVEGDELKVIRTPVFYVNDIMYTQALKLPVNDTYKLIDMRLFATGEAEDAAHDDNPLTLTNDLMVNAVPYTGSTYADLITAPVPVDLEISAFAKAEIDISILCYDGSKVEDFGFNWFRILETDIPVKYFFGDFCTKFFEDYKESAYYDDAHVMVDMPAIMTLQLRELEDNDPDVVADTTNTVNVKTFTNQTTYADGSPLRVGYPDVAGADNVFRLDVFIYVKVGSGFEYQKFGEWFWKNNDETMYPSIEDYLAGTNGFTSGTDGVYDYILGNCNIEGADFIFAPYMNLPNNISVTVKNPATAANAYFDITLAGFVDADYDLDLGLMSGYCFDKGPTISNKTFTQVDVYSSLYPELLPTGGSTSVVNVNWDLVNWLANNLDDYTGYTLTDIQQALWILEFATFSGAGSGDHGTPYTWVYDGTDVVAGGVGALSYDGIGGVADDIGFQMAVDACNNGRGYVPMPGGWAAVILDVDHSPENTDGQNRQTIFIRVDP